MSMLLSSKLLGCPRMFLPMNDIKLWVILEAEAKSLPIS